MTDKGLIDSRDKIKQLDKQGILASIEALPAQISDAWATGSDLNIDIKPGQVEKVVLVGMGGSALGGHVIKHLYPDLKAPFEVVSGYNLPGFVDKKSLVILSSYSGSTEEVLTAAGQAKERSEQVVVITTGGRLGRMARDNNWPVYLIDPVFNPSNQPRMAVGYAITGLLAIFNQAGLIKITDSQISQVVGYLKSKNKDLEPESVDTNIAKYLAYNAFRRIIAFVAADHLVGAVHVFNNQVNENAKNLTTQLVIPEMNHHFLEALPYPKQLRDDVVFFLFDSDLYLPRIQQRVALSQQVIEKSGFPNEIIKAEADDKLMQAFEIIQIGAYTSFYLAMLNGIDPSPIPNVDFLKAELKKQPAEG
ncbi:MAG: SIS domain-containing protein [bacterium]|nr:SIS domain-containing protein [bacterium]